MNTEIGFIGLGAMGSRIAGRLLDAGHHVYATNRTAAKAQPLIERGLIWLDTPREVAAAASVVISMVTDDDALDAIATGPDGLIAGLKPETVYIDMSTVSPHASRRVADLVCERGAHMLDAPVSGSIPQAETGTLAIMVGGDEHAFAAVTPLLRELGQTVTYIGPGGQGLVLKLAINISLAVQMLAFSEGLLLAERDGIDPHRAAEIMTESPIGSPMLKARAPLFLDPPDDAWFDVDLMQKDIKLALSSGHDLDVPLPSTTVVAGLLSAARRHGYERNDITVLFRLLSELSVARVSRRLGFAA